MPLGSILKIRLMTEEELRLRRQRYQRTYYLRHREACIKRAKDWYNEHKEYRRAYMLTYNKL